MLAFLKSRAKDYYKNLPYHNYDHALKVLANVKDLLEKCKKYDLHVDEEAVMIAALFHDAGYYQKTLFGSKEEYSAYIAEKELKALNFPEKTIKLVKECILATEKNADFTRPEQKILRIADLYDFSSDYKDFKKRLRIN